MLKVLYDGKCGICRKEIEYYQKIASPERFQWFDITSESAILAEYKLRLADVLLVLHTIDEQNNIYTGVDSFIKIWQRLPYWRFLAKIANLPFIKSTLAWLYKIFAERRFNRLEHCQLSLEEGN